MKLRQRIRFYQQLAMLVRAGLPIRASLERLRAQISARELKVLSRKINEGEPIGEAFAAAGFSPFEVHLIVAGERSAQLDTIFEHLSEYWKHELELRQALVRPLIYPVVLLHLVVIVSAIVEAVTVSYPAAVTHFILHMIELYALGFLIYVVVRVTWSSQLMRRIWFHVPLVGGALRTTYAYRWIMALRLQFSAGVMLSRAVGDAWRSSGYAGSERRAVEGEEKMRQGVRLSELIRKWRQLPRDWIDFVETGEISGKLEDAFRQLDAEAARTWKLAQERLAEWVPKIAYFVVLIFVAVQVGQLMYKVEMQPIIDIQKEIDAAEHN